jgi:hypothetical protein
MRFAYPEFLFAFLVLAVPIIIHLFNFRRYKTLYFSSIQFLKKLDENTKSVKQIKHWIILFLRLLAFSALVLAFAQPYIPGKSAAKSGQSTVMSVYLDNSFSMSAMGMNGSLLNQGKETIRKIVDKSPAGTNFQLITNALSGKESRLIRKTELLDRIDQIDFSPQSRKMRHILNFAKTSLDEQDQKGARQYLLVSDFQKQEDNFSDLKVDSLGIYYPFQMIPQSYDNLYIDSVWFESPLRKVNVTNELNIRIVNNGETDLTNVPLTLEVNEIKREIFTDIPALSSAVYKITYTDRQTGVKAGKVEIADNQLYFDDAFYFSYTIKENVNVLIINGENSDNAPKLVFDTDPYFKTTSMAINQVQFDEIPKNDIVILNALNEIPGALSTKLVNKVNAGGAIFILPGNKIDLGSYNNLLGQLALPLMTAPKENNRRLTHINYDAPFFTGMFDQRKSKLNLPNMNKVYNPQISVKSNFIKLINFEDDTPFFLQSNTSNSFVFYGSSDNEFGNLSRHGIFSAVLLRAGGISQMKNNLFNKLDGESIYKIGAIDDKNPRIHIISDQVDYIPQIVSKGAISVLNIDNELLGKLRAGNYEVQIENQMIDVLSLNYGREESNYTVYSENEILDEFQKQGIENIQLNTLEDFRDIEQLSLEKPIEYWRILLILGLLFFLTEMVLLKIWKI